MTDMELMHAALQARKMAYAPYSGFYVGAALLTADGRVYTGCNIENASYSPTNCAERTAFFKAVSEGVRDFAAIAIVGDKKETDGGFCAPCGVCRQVMAEFCDADFRVILGDANAVQAFTLAELLPASFSPSNL